MSEIKVRGNDQSLRERQFVCEKHSSRTVNVPNSDSFYEKNSPAEQSSSQSKAVCLRKGGIFLKRTTSLHYQTS